MHHTPHIQTTEAVTDGLGSFMALSGQEQYDQVPKCDQYVVGLQLLIISQTCIGWRQLFNGRFSSDWAEVQNKHLCNIR